MAAKPETLFKKRVKERLKLLGNIAIFTIDQEVIRGTPDLIICYKGRFIAWELKVGKNKATPLQQYHLDTINKCGGVGIVVTPENFDVAYEHLRTLCGF